MDKSLAISHLQSNSAKQAYQLILKVFLEFVGCGYSQQGIDEFTDYIETPKILERLSMANYLTMGAWIEDKLVGVIEIRDGDHVSLLFVDKAYHNLGIARQLLNTAIRSGARQVKEITVNSSPYAVKAYEKMGFAVTDTEKEVNGIRFVPMRMKL